MKGLSAVVEPRLRRARLSAVGEGNKEIAVWWVRTIGRLWAETKEAHNERRSEGRRGAGLEWRRWGPAGAQWTIYSLGNESERPARLVLGPLRAKRWNVVIRATAAAGSIARRWGSNNTTNTSEVCMRRVTHRVLLSRVDVG